MEKYTRDLRQRPFRRTLLGVRCIVNCCLFSTTSLVSSRTMIPHDSLQSAEMELCSERNINASLTIDQLRRVFIIRWGNTYFSSKYLGRRVCHVNKRVEVVITDLHYPRTRIVLSLRSQSAPKIHLHVPVQPGWLPYCNFPSIALLWEVLSKCVFLVIPYMNRQATVKGGKLTIIPHHPRAALRHTVRVVHVSGFVAVSLSWSSLSLCQPSSFLSSPNSHRLPCPCRESCKKVRDEGGE